MTSGSSGAAKAEEDRGLANRKENASLTIFKLWGRGDTGPDTRGPKCGAGVKVPGRVTRPVNDEVGRGPVDLNRERGGVAGARLSNERKVEAQIRAAAAPLMDFDGDHIRSVAQE